jgi:sugar/nucleoside kinase (ribokinase family)
MKDAEMREQCAARLRGAVGRVGQFRTFIGLDGFVDEIVHAVDKREDGRSYRRLSTMTAFSQRVAGAAGRSTNIELVNQLTKLGGNGPIMANALAKLSLQVTYLGALGYPNLHPVYQDFAMRAKVHSITDPGHTNALEFDDGKLMLTKSAHFSEITWPTIMERFGRDDFLRELQSADLVGFVNWTMIPHMSDVWEAMLEDVCPALAGPRRTIFFDLADPEKRTKEDLQRALGLISRFNEYFEVILGLNEKESCEVGAVLGLNTKDRSPTGLSALGQQIYRHVPIATLVIHPVTYALAVTHGRVTVVEGLYTDKPQITTGAGDHFNSGYCLGRLLGFDDPLSLLVGVATSGHYVINAQSPTVEDLANTLQGWAKSV